MTCLCVYLSILDINKYLEWILYICFWPTFVTSMDVGPTQSKSFRSLFLIKKYQWEKYCLDCVVSIEAIPPSPAYQFCQIVRTFNTTGFSYAPYKMLRHDYLNLIVTFNRDMTVDWKHWVLRTTTKRIYYAKLFENLPLPEILILL